jgi:hypothetical protein
MRAEASTFGTAEAIAIAPVAGRLTCWRQRRRARRRLHGTTERIGALADQARVDPRGVDRDAVHAVFAEHEAAAALVEEWSS